MISPESFEQFSVNFTQMLLSVLWWAEHLTQLSRLNVTGQGQGIYPWISCPLHISWTLLAIFIKLHPNAPLSETKCKPMTRLHRFKVKVTLQSHGIYPSIHVRSISPEPLRLWTDFIKLHPNVPLSEVVCRTNGSATQTQGQGHTSRSWYLPLNFVTRVLQISSTIC